MPKAMRLAVLHFTLVAWRLPISSKASVRRPIQKMPPGSYDKHRHALGAVTAIMKLEPFLKPEFAMCPPPDVLRDSKDILAQMILSITAYLKSHPEQRLNNFHQTAVTALVAAWPCAK